MESPAAPQTEPTVRIDALETFVELLSRVEADPSSDAFYSRLCEATCRLADMDRAVIFRYDGARRRVRAAGSFGIPLDTFADAQVTVETVPVARESLLEDRVIEISSAMAEGVPDEFKNLIHESTLVCTPMAAAGRWLGVILSDRGPDRPPLQRLRALPALHARQDRRAGRLRPPGDEQAGPGAPAAGADGPRARGARVGDPAPVRHPARLLQPGGAQPRRARADRRRAAGRAAGPAPRAPAPARPRRARRPTRRSSRRSSGCAASIATCT